MKRLALFLSSLAICLCTSAQQRNAVVCISTDYIRVAPDYESSLDAQALMGTAVTIVEEQGYWRKIEVGEPKCSGWVTELGLVEMSEEDMADYKESGKYICTAALSHVYSSPSLKSTILTELIAGDIVRKGTNANGTASGKGNFYKVVLPSGVEGFTLKKDLSDHEKWSRSHQGKIADIINMAVQYKGSPYLWGGNSPKGFDCSGLVWFCFHMNGIELPRNTSQQAQCGREVSLDEIEAGDLLFFGNAEGRINHVAIYQGDGKIIQSSQLVRINSIIPGTPDFYDRAPVTARRICGNNSNIQP